MKDMNKKGHEVKRSEGFSHLHISKAPDNSDISLVGTLVE